MKCPRRHPQKGRKTVPNRDFPRVGTIWYSKTTSENRHYANKASIENNRGEIVLPATTSRLSSEIRSSWTACGRM